jgi:hypothetical protein
MRKFALYAVPAIGALLAANVARAQRGVDWMTDGYDAQRSSWVRSDGKISPESMRKPGFALVWQLKFENTARQLNTLTPPALLDFYIGYRGFRSFAFIGMVPIAWWGWMSTSHASIGTRSWPPRRSRGHAALTGGMTSAVTRPTSIAYPPFSQPVAPAVARPPNRESEPLTKGPSR